MSGFYFSPIGLAIWYFGKIPGYSLAILAIASRLYVTWLAPPLEKNMITGTMEAVSIAIVMFVFCYLVSREKDRIAEFKTQSETDFLTNAKIRGAFMKQSAIELTRAERMGHPVSLIYIDVDKFKAINDNHGHQAGDKLLNEMGSTILNSLRPYDIFGRIGGDEFAVLLPETDRRGASSVARRIHRLADSIGGKLGLPVSVSIGIATTGLDSTATIDDLLHKADLMMYSAKNGRAKAGNSLATGATTNDIIGTTDSTPAKRNKDKVTESI